MTDNLPAVSDFGPTGTPLSAAPTSALAFALGWSASQPVRAEAFGGFTALVEELMARPSGSEDAGPIGGWDQRREFGVIMSLLPPEMSRSIVMLYQAQRGMRWSRTGVHRPPSGNSD